MQNLPPKPTLILHADKAVVTLPITPRGDQPIPAGYDNNNGLIDATTVVLPFNSVFTSTAGGYNGFVRVSFSGPNEPYMAFDYAQLSHDPEASAIPEPSTYLTLTGLILCFGLAGWWRKRRRTA